MSNVAVYAKGSTDFTTQGLGILSDVESSKTTQTVSNGGNVTSQLELEYPVKGRLVDKLIEGNFIRVSMATDSSKYMVYEISDTLKDDSGIITVYADPYSDRIGRMSFENGGKFGSYNSVQAALTYAKSQIKDFPSTFQLTSNISKSVDFTKDGIIPNFKKFLDLLNTKVSGNVYYGLNVIQIYSALGKDRSDIILRDDRNTSSVKVKTDYSSIINRIIPVLPVKDKDGNATQETTVGTPVISKTPNQFIDYWSAEVVQLDTQDLANTYFDRTHADRPVQTVDVDPLSMSEDFSDIDIFDRVQIYSSRLNYTDKLRVSSRVIDNLTGQVTKFSLGNSSVSIYNTIEGQTQSVANQIKAITSVVISASGKNRIYTSNVQPTSANEGDMWIQEDGDYQAFWVFKNGDWIRLIDSNTQKDIADAVITAVEQAKVHTEEAKQVLSSDINAAKSQAASQASEAEANAKSAATSQFNQAQDALAAAKANLQNDIDESKGNIVEINQTLTGFDGTLQRVQNAVNEFGQTNQLMNTEFTPDFQGWGADAGYELSSELPTYEGSNVIHIKTTNTGYDYLRQSVPVAPGQVISFGTMMKFAPTSPDNSTVYWRYSLTFYKASGGSSIGVIFGKINYQALDWTLQKSENVVVPADAAYMNVTYYLRGAGEAWLSKPMLVFESTIGTYIQGNYNNNDALAKVKLTADQAKLDLSTYITDADGRIRKAQSDIEVNATAITTKVSQTDYDKKTGELSTKLNTTTDTANGTKQALSDYKEYANGNISGLSSDLIKLAGEVDLKLTKTVYDNDQSTLNTSLSQWKDDYDGWTGTVSKLSDKVNDLGQVNQLLNTEFNPDLEGWTLYADQGSSTPYRSYSSYGSRGIGFNTLNAAASTFARLSQTILLPYTRLSSDVMSLTWRVNTRRVDNYCHLWLVWQDGNGVSLGQSTMGTWNDSTLNRYNVLKWENISIPIDAKQVDIRFETREGTQAYLFQPMVSFTPTIGRYVQGNYNNNAALAQVKITADSISNFVRDSNGNLSSTFQDALSKTSIITGSTLATSIQKQTATQITQALTDNNKNIIAMINLDTSGVQIAGKNIILDGTVTATSDFWAKQINAIKVSASNIKVGILNGNEVNIINVNAGNISSGIIRGIDMIASDITLNNENSQIHGDYDWKDLDEVIFPRSYTGTWNLGTRRLAFNGKVTPTNSEDGGAYNSYTYYGLDVIKMRRLFATGNIYKSLDINAGKGEIYIRKRDTEQQDANNNVSALNADDLQIRGDHSRIWLSTSKIMDTLNTRYTTRLSSGKVDDTDAYVHTYTLRAKRFFQPYGYDDGQNVWMYFNPNSDDSTYGLALLQGDQIIASTWAYNRTYSYASNMYITSNGYIGRVTSASKYKLAITHYDDLDRANKLLSIKPARWFDKAETELYANELNGKHNENEEHLPVKPHFGLIAEDLVEAGLEEFVSYGSDGQVEGLEYDRVWTALIPLIKNMKERIEELERKVS